MTTDKKARKEMPVARGVFDYFPDAIAAVANVSYVGNQQHNPGQEMHWAREKSTDHADCVARHLIERGTIDDDGLRHSAKMAWRSLALLQLEIEQDQKSESLHSSVHLPDGSAVEATAYEKPFRLDVSYVPYADDITFDVYPAVFMPETSEAVKPPVNYRAFVLNQLRHALGCSEEVARQIAGGTSINTGSKQYVYIAGPMRGYDKFNFPAFDAARDEFLHHGWNVISPADIDRAAGFSESVPDQPLDQRTFAHRDFYSLYLLAHLGEGAIAMLPGWEKSTGAVAEFFLARWLGLKILDGTTGVLLSRYNVNHHAIAESVRTFLNGQK